MDMLEKSIKEFIEQNLEANTSDLMFKYGKDTNLKYAIAQIAARQKIKSKLPSIYYNQEFILPAMISLEQASSEITAKYKADITNYNTSCDLTGGFGIDTLFIAKRSAKHIYIEQNKELCEVFQKNIKSLHLENIEIINSDSLSILKELQEIPEFVFLDPARRSIEGKKTYYLEDTFPNPIEAINIIKDKFKKVLIKTSPMLDISRAVEQLPFIKEVHIVSVKNECKELLFLLENQYEGKINYKTVNFTSDDSSQNMDFEENSGKLAIAKPNKYIYEANSSISKLGFWKNFTERYNLAALDINTHIFTSEQTIENFPGRVFELLEICKINKKDLSKTIPNKKANITIKNVPISIGDFKKKTGFKEGGDFYIFVVKSAELANVCLVCKKNRAGN